MKQPAARLLISAAGPAGVFCYRFSARMVLAKIALVAILFFTSAFSALAINAPTITHVAGVAVTPDTTMYSNQADFQVKGNAEAGTEVKLYRATTLIGTAITSGLGVWTVNLTSQTQGTFQYTATAYDGLFTSEPSVAVPVIVDTTPPYVSIQYGSTGCRSDSKYQCNNIGYLRFIVTDSLAGPDFSTAQLSVDYADVPGDGNPDDYVVSTWYSLAGYTQNNGVNEVNFYSNTGFGTINQNYRKIRILGKIYDRAGNETTQVTMFYNNARANQVAAIVEKIWDPGHNIFTGTGEPTSNLPDAEGWVNYYPYMTVINNPPKVRARAEKWSLANQSFHAWDVYCETYNRTFDIDQATGRFIVTYPVLPYGDVSLNFGPRGGDCRPGKYTNIRLKTTSGAPNSIRSWGPYSGEQKIIGSRVWPDFYGKVSKMPFNQTVQIGYGDYSYTTWKPSLSQVVLPQGESYPGTAGVYNHGDVWYDANDNGDWDEGELFHDMPAQISDGESFNLVNFREVLYSANTAGSTLGGLVRNNYGKSTASRIVRYHHNEVNPPSLSEITPLPTVPTGQYRRAATKPSEIVVKTKIWGATWSGFYYIKGDPSSKVRLFNGTNNEIAIPTTSWTEPSALNYATSVSLDSVTLPDATYRVDVRVEDSFNLVTQDSTRWFIIDNAAPKLSDVVPADGVLSNTFTSFSAKVVDDDLPDLTAGSGANIDVAKPQIWPYKVLTLQETCGSTNAILAFDLADGLSSPIDHQGVAIPRYAAVKIFEVIGGVYQPVAYDGTIDRIRTVLKRIEVRLDSKFQNGKTYQIMYEVPFFTSNNGYDRVGAVPISPIIADGTYVSRILVCDKAGNEGTFDFKSSPLEVARGTITYTFDRPFLFAGLTPHDIGWFTTSSVTTSKGNPVSDGQQLSLVQTPNNLTRLTPADANGIPGDGHQVLFGANGAPVGTGVAKFGVEVLTASPGSMSVYGVIALANGTSAAVPIYLIDQFSLVSGASIIDITPGNPSPTVTVSTSSLGKSTRLVPDNTIAECSTDFGSLTVDADLTMPGVQTKALSGVASIIVTSATKGDATVTMSMGGRSANTLVTFRDRYPPPAPTNLTLTPLYSNTGSALLSWTASADLGGAGTARYFVEQSANNGTTWTAIQTVTTNSCLVSGLVSGSYRFRVKAQDNDNNTGTYSAMSISLVVDTVAPVAVACSDVGAGNNDPDEQFSSDSQVYFYFSPTDERSGVGDVQIQISTATDTSGVVAEPWVGPTSPYLFPDGEAMKTYYARVRVKDKAGNVGAWGSWSNGIMVVLSGAVTPPNAPTVTRVSGKNAVPGVPLPINITSSIKVEGMSEASNLISVYVDGVYKQSVISDTNGNFQTFISLTTGSHALKVRAHNGFAESAFSNTITVVVDQTKPGINRVIYDVPGFTRGGQYFGTTASDHNLATLDFYLSDGGGSGFDISSFKAVLTEIEDDGTLVTPVAPYKNPVTSSVGVIAADRVRLLPDGAWKDCLQTGHRYRMAYEVSDFAGNKTSATFDFIIDNNKPGMAEEVPADTVPAHCNIKSIYVYDYEKYPSGYPPASALVPYKWDTSVSAFLIDPDFVDDNLVDRTTTPHALKFNTLALYGTLYAADPSAPAPQKWRDVKTESFNIAWGYGSGITSGPDGLGNYKSFRFPFRTVTNGLTSQTLIDQDRAICRNGYTIRFWVNSGDPAPSAPQSVQFCNASNQAMTYAVWTSYGSLFGSSGGSIRDRELIITDNSDAMLAKVTIPVEMFAQRVEVYRSGVGVIASATVSPGNNTANLVIDYPGPVGSMLFQIRTYANGYYSTNLPKYLNYYWYYWVKGDTAAPTTFELYPTDTYFNALSGADARPFPSQFSVKAKDTANGSLLSFLEISKTEISFIGATGVLSRDYDTSRMEYGYRYQLDAVPTVEGTYYYKVLLPDASRPTSHTTTAQFPFKLDKTAPIPLEVNPSDGAVTNSLPSFNAKVGDPLLADGTPGSGPNMDPSRAQISPFKTLGSAVAASTNSLTVTVYGIDTVATDHVDKTIPVDTEIMFAKSLAGGKFEYPTVVGKITSNGSVTDKLTAVVTSGALTVGTTYAIIYPIPNFASNDGIDRIAAVPVQPAIKGGAYLVFLKLIDNSLNQGSYSSASSIYEAAYGTFSLSVSRNSLYVGLYPPHTANYTSSAILSTEGNPINPGTEISLLTNIGSFYPADSNGIPGDGHQVKSVAGGYINFGLQATGNNTGVADVRAVLGLASGTDTSVSFVQVPPFTVSLVPEELYITAATPNPSTTGTTSQIGNAGDLVPNGTGINLSTTLGTITTPDAYPEVAGSQVKTTSGVGSFVLSSSDAGFARLTIEVGGRTVEKEIAFIDRYPPNAPGTPSPDNVLNNNGVFSLFWSAATDPANSGIAEYGVEYSLNSGAYTFLASTTTSSFMTSGLPEGQYTFRVRAVDGAGNVGAYSAASVQVEVNTTPPTGSILVNGGNLRTGNPTVSLTLSANDPQGVGDMAFSNDGVNWGSWVTYATSQTWTLSAGDGNKLVYVKFRDTLGNAAVFNDDILLDTTPPMGTVKVNPSPFSNTRDLTVSFSANDTSGVSNMSYRYDGGSWVSRTYTPTLAWTVAAVNATHTVEVRYIDSLGNTSEIFSGQNYVDLVSPSAPTVTDDGDYSPWIDKLHATWSSSDPDSGIDHYLVSVGDGKDRTNVVAETDVGAVNEYTFSGLSLDLTGTKNYYFNVYAVDRAGNRSDAAYSNGIKGGDPSPPLAVTVTDEGNFTADNTKLSATWNASSDPDSGISRYEVSIGTTAGGTNVMGWVNNSLNLSYTATGLNLAHNTTYYINVRIYNGGGTPTVCSSNGIKVDTAAPPVPTMLAEPAYSSGTVNIVGCAAVTDPVSGGVTYYFERATNSAFSSGLANSGWISANGYTFTSLSNGTTYYFRVRARDAVLNTSAYSATVSSIQDSNVPTATNYTDNVALNNDPDYVWSRDATVSFTATGLTDNLSGVKNVYVQISNAGNFSTILWEGWTGNTTGAKTYTVSSPVDGNVIYARAKYEDVAGNYSSAWQTTDGITLDLTNPVAGATTDAVAGNNDPNHSVSKDANIYFGFTHSDAVSGVADVHIQVARDTGFTQIATSTLLGSAVTSYQYKSGEDGKTYYARIRVRDHSGRYSDNTLAFSPASSFGARSDGIRVDLTPPSFTNTPFFINKKADAYLGESTTATSVVHLTFTVDDPSGVAKVQVSNNGTTWTTWNNPVLDPASYSWALDLVPGLKTVWVMVTDGIGHTTSPASQTIEYWPGYQAHKGTRDERSYPTDTYDEYSGQNKYGSPRTDPNAPSTGVSLRLEKK